MFTLSKIKSFLRQIKYRILLRYDVLQKKIGRLLAHAFKVKSSESGFTGIELLIVGGVVLITSMFVSETISNAIAKVTLNVVIFFATLFLTLLQSIAGYSSGLLSYIMGKVLNGEWRIVNDPVFLLGWVETRNLGNMLIVLAIIGIAVATILRFKEYEAKKLLLPMIVVALLINFSGVICGIIIDISNIAMQHLLRDLIQPNPEFSIILKLNSAQAAIVGRLSLLDNLGAVTNKMGAIVQFIVIYIVLIITFWYLALILLARYVVLGILFIFSPLAFVFRVFPLPQARKLWNDWWENFIKWNFIGLGGVFCIWLGGKMMATGGTNAIDVMVVNGSNFADFQIRMFVVCMIFIIGLKMTTKTAKPFSQAVMGAAAAVYTGGGSYFAGKTANVTGLTRAKNAVVDRATSIGERMGFVKENTTRRNQKARLEVAEKELALSTDEELAEMGNTKTGIFNNETRMKKAAAISILADRKKLTMIDKEKREEAAAHAVALGAEKSTITKEHPELLTGLNNKAGVIRTGARVGIRKTLQFAGIDKALGATGWEDALRTKGERTARQSLLSSKKAELENAGFDKRGVKTRLKRYSEGLSDLDIRVVQQKLHAEKVRERALGYSSSNSQQIKGKAVEMKVEAQKGAWKTAIDATPGMSNDQKEVLLQERIERGRKEFAKEEISGTEFLHARTALIEEKVKKAVKRLSPNKAIELPSEAISPETVLAFTSQQVELIGKRGSANLIDEIKKYVPEYTTSPTTGKKNRINRANQDPEVQRMMDRAAADPGFKEKWNNFKKTVKGNKNFIK